MTIDEQLDSVLPCLLALRDVMPRGEKEDFIAWIGRGLGDGLITKEENDMMTRIFVYQPMLLVRQLQVQPVQR